MIAPRRLHPPSLRATALFTAMLALSLTASTALADWPLHRGDAHRTGVAPQGTSAFGQPEIAWQQYLGGALSSNNITVLDVDGDGVREIAFISGGRVLVKDGVGDPVWESAPLGVVALEGAWDLDGDGQLEIVARASNRAILLDALTGTPEWFEPPDEMGTLAAIRVADVDGDGLPDLMIQECGCCGVNSGNNGFTYSFANNTPTLLWTFPFGACGGTRSTVVLDADGDGTLEVLLADSTNLNMIDGETGAVLASLPGLQVWIPGSYCWPTQLDGAPGDEVLCVLSTPLASAENHRTVYRLDYDAVTPALLQPWEVVLGPNDIDVAYHDPVVDLDGDGIAEFVIATKLDDVSPWQTRVFDADGLEIETLDGHEIVGHAPLGAGGASVLLTSNDTGLHAHVWDAGLSQLSLAWTLTGHIQLYGNDARRHLIGDARRVLHTDLTGDGVEDLLLYNNPAGEPGLTVYDVSSGTPEVALSFDYPARFTAVSHALLDPFNREYEQIAVVRDDGFLTVFDDMLSPIFLGQDGGIPGIRVGGYYASGRWRDLRNAPLLAQLAGDAHDTLFARDSRGYLLRLDPSAATSSSPPAKVWERAGVQGASLIDGLDPAGGYGLACMGTTTVSAINTDNDELWTHTVGVDVVTINDVLPAQLDGVAGSELVFQWGETSNTLQQVRALDASNGETLWDAVAFESGAGRQPAGLSVDDITGDGVDDVLLAGPGMKALDGTTGVEAVTLVHSASYGMLSRFDVDADGAREVVFHGSNARLALAESDLSAVLWSDAEDARAYPYGAVVQCASGARLVSASWLFPSRVKVVDLTTVVGDFNSFVLGGGALYPDAAAADAAGVFHGQLTSITVHPDLRGDGQPVAFAGSVDGFLYAFDPCLGELVFSVDFGVAVGLAVFGDTDGDGRDEVLVSVADGYLYNLRPFALDPPASVLDVTPTEPLMGPDVFDVETRDALAAIWDPVADATRYEYAIDALTAGGRLLDWTTTTETQVLVTGLALENDARYRFVIRAFDGDDNASVDAVSSGVRVSFPPPVDDTGDVSASDMSPGDTSAPADTTPPVDTSSGGEPDAAAQDTGTTSGGDVVTVDEGAPGTNGGSEEGCGCDVLQSRAPRRPLGALFGLLALVLGLGVVRRRV